MIYFFILILSCACAIPALAQQPPTVSMTLQVKVPANTPSTDTVWILSGLIFNAAPVRIPMNRVSGTTDTWQASISAPERTVFRYFYNRNNSYLTPESYVPFETWSPNTFNYRELIVRGGVTVSETVAKWKGITTATVSTGIVTGKVTDQNGQPLNGIRVSAGPHQRMTSADGVYLIEGVPSGSCTLTIRSENGEYQAFTAIVNIDTSASTQKDIVLTAAQMSTVTFNVRVPNDTPAFAVPRLYGDSYRLGMVEEFGAGSVAAEPTRSIEMTPAGVNHWTYSAQLGNGTCVTYLYTLGHFARNNEKAATGAIVTRSLSINGPTTVDDTVAAWKTPQEVPVSLTVTSPTGGDDVLYVTMSEDQGGSWLMKMWPTGPGMATYTIYAKPNTTLNYRYIRNADPYRGKEIIGTDSTTPVYRSIPTGPGGTSSTDTVTAWRDQSHEQALTSVATGIDPPIKSRSAEAPFQTGFEEVDSWSTRWLPLVDRTMARIKSKNAQWVQIVPGWAWVNLDSLRIERIPGSMPDQDLITHIRSAKGVGLKVAIKSAPFPNPFPSGLTHARLDQFFHEIEVAALHDSKIAQQEGCELFILTEFYFYSPNNTADNNPEVRTYVNAKWKGVIAAIRANGYTGKITADGLFGWSIPELDWQGDLDYIGAKWWWPVATTDHDTVQQMYESAMARLNSDYLPIVKRFHKPIMFAEVAFSSANGTAMQRYGIDDPLISPFLPADPSVPSDYDEQARAFQAVLLALANTPWVAGAYVFGYEYFKLDSKGHTTTGKTADEIISQVYQKLNQATLTVNVLPSIVGQPQNQTANLGQSVTFNVIAYGTAPLTYQWQFNGVNLAGATNATLSLTNIQGLDSGIYTVVISNSFGSVTSVPATLDVVRTIIINKFDNSAEASQWRFDFGKAAHSAVFDPTVDADGNRSSGSFKIALGFDTALGTENKGAFTRDIAPAIDGSTLTSIQMDVLVDPNSAHDQSGVNANTSLVIRNGNNFFYNPQVYRDLKSSSGWVHIETPLSGAVDQIRALTWHVWGAAPQNINGTVTMWIDNVVFNQRVTATSISITAQPKDQAVAAGQAVTFSVSATSSLPLSYQWQFNGANILGATSSTLTLPNVQASNAGNYRVIVSNSAGTMTSAVVTLTVSVPPSISAQPQSQAVNLGGSVTFNVVVSGTAPFAYQWQKDGVAIPGATGPALTVNNVQFSNVGSYTVVVSNAAGSVSSAAAILSVGKVKQTITFGRLGNKQAFDPPFALNATASSGLPVQFSASGPATVSGNVVTVSVAGTIVIRASQPGNEQFEAAPSVEQSFQVIDPTPQIKVQPKSQIAGEGTTIQFTVEASGAAPLNYQWQFNGVNLSGANRPTLNLNNVQSANAGSYTVIVSNSFGSVTSAAATLAMTPLLVINRFDNAAEAGQWRFDFGQATRSTVFDPSVDANGNASSGSLKIAIGFNTALGNENKAAFTRNISPALDGSNITSLEMDVLVDPSSARTLTGVSANTSLVVRNGSGLFYNPQVYRDIGSASGWIHITTPLSGAVDDIRALTWHVWGASPQNLTGSVTLWIDNVVFREKITINTQPVNQIVMVGQTVTFSVSAAADSALSYQWQFNGVNRAGAINSTLTLANVQSSNAGSYRVVVTGAGTSVTSAAAILTIALPPSISVQPQSQAVNLGVNVALSVVAVGTTPLNYQWRKNDTDIPGATSATLAISSVQVADAGSYTVVVSNAAGSVTSAVVTLAVNAPPSISLQPQSQTVVSGASVTFSSGAIGTAPLSYQWQFSGVNIPAANGPSLTLKNIQPSDAGSYQVVVSNSAGSVSSAAAILTVNVPPSIFLQPQSQAVNSGTNASFNVVATGTPPLNYLWQKDGMLIPRAIDSTLTLTNVQPADAGNYNVLVSNSSGSVTSAVATLTVNVPPLITSQPQSQTAVVGATVSFAVNATGTAPLVYQWRKNATDLSGATNATLALNNVRVTDAGDYTVVVTNMAGSVTSSPAGLSVAKASQAIAFDLLGAKTYGDVLFPLFATASSGLPVVFSVTAGPAVIEGGAVRLVGAGNVTIRASQPGDENYSAAAEVEQSFAVAKANQTFSFGPLIDKRLGDGPFSLNALASSGLPVTFGIVSGPATVAGNLVTLTGAGTVLIRASQGGDLNYNAASSVDHAFHVLGGIVSFKYAPTDGFSLLFTGETGRTYALEVSNDLVVWIALETRSNVSGQLGFTDARSVSTARFYRVRLSE